MTQEEDDTPSIAEITRLLQELVDDGAVTVKTTDENSVLNNTYVITDFGHWLVETEMMHPFTTGDNITKAKIKKQYEEQK